MNLIILLLWAFNCISMVSHLLKPSQQSASWMYSCVFFIFLAVESWKSLFKNSRWLIQSVCDWFQVNMFDSEVECKVINRPVTCSWFIRSGSSASPCTTRSQPSSITTPLRRTPPPLNTRTFLLPGPSASPSLLGKMSACLRIHLGVDEAAVPPPQFWLLPKALSLLFQPCQQSEGWAT